MPRSIEELEAKFNAKLRDTPDKKRSSSKHLSADKCKWIIIRLGEIALNPTEKKNIAGLSNDQQIRNFWM